jgi:hypothetical protein
MPPAAAALLRSRGVASGESDFEPDDLRIFVKPVQVEVSEIVVEGRES